MPTFVFSESHIVELLESNAIDLKNVQDVIMQAELYKQRGLLYLEAIKIESNYQKAFAYFNKAIALNADDKITAFCLSKRASLNIAQKKFTAGIADFVAACKLVKNNADIWLEYGQALVYLERLEEALEPLRKALILRPHYNKTHELIETVIRSEQVSINCLDDIKALMALERKLNVGKQKDSGLHLWLQVVQAGDSDFMSYLALEVDTQMHDGMENTALHYAVRAGHIALIEPLVKNYHINPNAENRDGLTPLMLALRTGDSKLIEKLVSVGAKYSGTQLPLVAFQNFSLPAAVEEERIELRRTTSFRVFN